MSEEDPLRSVLRLFLSADIVGSTAFKQKPASSGDLKTGASAWLSPISGFFREMERLFALEWKRCADGPATKHGWPMGEPPSMWKGMGDEVVYIKTIDDHRQATCAVQCWMRAVASYRKILKGKTEDLDVKSSAWIAGFPISNTEIVFRSKIDFDTILQSDDDPVIMSYQRLQAFYQSGGVGYIQDFIGPAIDTGFRVSALATPRKMTITVDLALLLAIPSQPPSFDLPELRMHYDGRITLKGVLGGKPYPVFGWTHLMRRTFLLVQRTTYKTERNLALVK